MIPRISSSLHDPQRLAALRSTGLLGTPREEDFDRLTRLSAQLLHAPVAVIALVDDRRQFFKSAVGLPDSYDPEREVPLAYSYCKYIVRSGKPLVLSDAREHRSLRGSPAIQELGMVSYAGIPLRTGSGHVLGTLFVADSVPRVWRADELRLLEDFAQLAANQISLCTARQLDQPRQDLSPKATIAAGDLLQTTQLRTLVEQSIAGLGIIQNGRVGYANRALAQMFGYTEEEMLALPSVLELISDEDREMVSENLRQRVEGTTRSLQYRFRGRRKDGRQIHVEVHGTRTEAGGAPVIVGVLIDVTERLVAEAALRPSEIRMRRILDLAHDAFIATDEDGVITDWNAQAERTFGWASHEVIGVRLADTILPEEYRDAYERRMSRFLATGQGPFPDRIELSALHKDGYTLPVELSVTPVKIGQYHAFSAFLRDIRERKQAEDALRESEERFRSLIENAWDVIHVQDEQGMIRYMSPSVERTLGYRPEEMIGRSAEEFIHPDDAPRAAELYYADIQQPGTERFIELRLRHRDGSWRTVEIRGKVVAGPSGAPLAIVHTHDVTEHAQILEVLRRSEERFRLVGRATNDLLWEWDVESGEIRWSEVAPRFFRCAPGEVGSTIEWWAGRIHPDDRDRVVAGLDRHVEGVGETWSDEYRVVRRDGVCLTVLDRGFAVRDERGRALRMIGTIMDVTERRQAEEAQRFLARASALLESSLDPALTLPSLARSVVPVLADCCVIDLVKDGALRRVAAAHTLPDRETLLLDGEPRPLNAHDDDLIGKVVRERAPLLVQQAADASFAWLPLNPDRPDGGRRPETYSAIVVPLLMHAEILGIITLAAAESRRRYGPADLTVAEDLARRIALTLENARLYRRAQEVVRDREQILGVVSHDLRSPLAAIMITADHLRNVVRDLAPEARNGLAAIQRSADQMERMIADLLDLSSIYAGRLSISPGECDLVPLIQEICDSFQPLAAQKSISLSYDAATSRVTAWVDANRIYRVFLNLVENALKFTPEGGSVVLRSEPHGEGICCSVADTGPGLPEEELPRVFNRYWQAKGDQRGVGLGLSIARGIVEAHGGEIWVQSAPGRGTTFFFTVPAPPSSEVRRGAL